MCWRRDAAHRGLAGDRGRFEGRTLFLTGATATMCGPSTREAIRALFPKGRFARTAGVGHWLHAEKPREFAETVEVFLSGDS